MTNKERFNALLNRCQDPRAVYAALLAFAKSGTLGRLREGAAKAEKGPQP